MAGNISKQYKNFFKVPHGFEERYGDELNPSEKYFFTILLKLENRCGNKNGWFWHVDKLHHTQKGYIIGLEKYGFSVSSCKRIRKKLIALGLIETRLERNQIGNRAFTYYRIKWENILLPEDFGEPKDNARWKEILSDFRRDNGLL